jgi:hypothetical protein
VDQAQLIDYLIAKGADWIRDQRTAHSGSAIPLSTNAKAQLRPYFTDEILSKAKVSQIATLENPPFYSELAQYGIPIPLDFSSMLGITFDDTVVLARSLVEDADLSRLTFHELVHVTQYHFLGIDKFMKQYVSGWASNGFDYYSIPLEVEAYGLDQQYSDGKQFCVYEILQVKYSAV